MSSYSASSKIPLIRGSYVPLLRGGGVSGVDIAGSNIPLVRSSNVPLVGCGDVAGLNITRSLTILLEPNVNQLIPEGMKANNIGNYDIALLGLVAGSPSLVVISPEAATFLFSVGRA